jgi:hypothetical protein
VKRNQRFVTQTDSLLCRRMASCWCSGGRPSPAVEPVRLARRENREMPLNGLRNLNGCLHLNEYPGGETRALYGRRDVCRYINLRHSRIPFCATEEIEP